MNLEESRKLLHAAALFYATPEELAEDPELVEEEETRLLNMNDVWAWALADCCKVEDEEFPELARLFRAYGYCGVLYWVAKKQGIEKSEFHDITRFIEFVRNEERIINECPDWNKRAYYKSSYKIG